MMDVYDDYMDAKRKWGYLKAEGEKAKLVLDKQKELASIVLDVDVNSSEFNQKLKAKTLELRQKVLSEGPDSKVSQAEKRAKDLEAGKKTLNPNTWTEAGRLENAAAIRRQAEAAKRQVSRYTIGLVGSGGNPQQAAQVEQPLREAQDSVTYTSVRPFTPTVGYSDGTGALPRQNFEPNPDLRPATPARPASRGGRR